MIPFISFSQDSVKQDSCPEFVVVEIMPEFPGGTEALLKYISDNIQYPQYAKEHNIEGKVFVNFVIDTTGKVIRVKVVKGVDPSLDAEAVRVIESLPLWKPGMQKGKPVMVLFTIPINFSLLSRKEYKKAMKEADKPDSKR